jgi:hypothetical protein
MIVCLSERRFSEQIKQLEGLDPATTVSEVTERMPHYAARFFNHLRNFGVNCIGIAQQRGDVADFQFALKQSWSEEDVQTRLDGLTLLAPVSVSLDQPDLLAFVTNPIMLASMTDNWTAFSASLQRLDLSEVRPALENAALQILSAPVKPPTNEFEKEMQQMEYEAFLVASGRKDPLERHNKIEQFRQQEEANIRAQQEATYEAFRNGE